METTFIYVLKDPRTNEVRYVGKSNNPHDRYQGHINKSRDKNTHKRNWINQLRNERLKPIMEIIDEVSKNEWKQFEKFYIKKYIDEGCNLVNCTDGGDGLSFGNQTSFKKGDGMKKIIALNLDGTVFRIFDSTVSAIKELNLKNPSIWHVLNKKFKISEGYNWLRLEEYEKMSQEQLKEHIIWFNTKKEMNQNSGWFKNKYDKIYQYDLKTGEFIKEWNSSKEASFELDLNQTGILNCVSKKCKSAYGFYWSYEKNKNYKEKKQW